ncbi:hypothetical protein VA249_15670 [Vibrio alfacsensis]|uniref:hypothetical protein n=1 Tax=Vibrio alfacsensis TaxID=1074311 RepID=UPI001BEE4A44|nr:hypothetical protein [Vibrio alfacsensis]BBM64921.1 hypothetical protein VA249_15670 [Vibrio alfacsensis]
MVESMDEVKLAMEAIQIYQVQYDQVDKVWGYFSAVTLAISGFVVGSDKATRSIKEPIAILIAYWFFCYGNHLALIAGQEQLIQLGDIAVKFGDKAGLNISSFDPLSTNLVGNFHIGAIIAVSLGILVISVLRHKKST